MLDLTFWCNISDFWTNKIQTACMCYNSITGSVPSFWAWCNNTFTVLPAHSALCQTHARMLKYQPVNRKTHVFRTFSHFGSHAWNNLPQDIRHSATRSSFKSKSKIFLFSEYFSEATLSYCTVCVCVRACVRACVRVCIFHIVTLEPLLMSILCVSFC